MNVKDSDPQNATSETKAEGSGRKPREHVFGELTIPAESDSSTPDLTNLMEAVIADENLAKAIKRVESNKGAAGIDNRTVSGLRPYLK